MKVLLVSTYDATGGAARATFRLHQALNASGVDCRMRVMHKGSDAHTVEARHTRRELIAGRIVNRFIGNKLKKLQRSANNNPRSLALFGGGLVDEINQSDVDVVNLHWVLNEMISIRDISRITKPLVWTLHDMWAFCGAEHVCADGPDARWRQGYTKGNRPDGDAGFDIDRWTWERKRKHWVRPRQMVVPSHWMSDCVQGSALMREWPVSVIPTPLDLTIYRPWPRTVARQMFGLPDGVPLILFGAWGGRADGNKGADLLEMALPEIMAQLPHAELVVFGQSAPAESSKFSTQPIHYLGALRDEYSLAMMYSAADVMVVPSRCESLCQTALEAQACGTPVVCFDTSGLIDSVDHDVTGFRVTPYSPKELSVAIIRILLDFSLRDRLGAAGPSHVAKLCEGDLVADRYKAVFEGVIERSC